MPALARDKSCCTALKCVTNSHALLYCDDWRTTTITILWSPPRLRALIGSEFWAQDRSLLLSPPKMLTNSFGHEARHVFLLLWPRDARAWVCMHTHIRTCTARCISDVSCGRMPFTALVSAPGYWQGLGDDGGVGQ